jgi:hypothetical protein
LKLPKSSSRIDMFRHGDVSFKVIIAITRHPAAVNIQAQAGDLAGNRDACKRNTPHDSICDKAFAASINHPS